MHKNSPDAVEFLSRKLPISNRCKLKPWSVEPNIIKSRSISITSWPDITLFSRLVWHLQGGSPSDVCCSVKPMNDRYIYHKPKKSKSYFNQLCYHKSIIHSSAMSSLLVNQAMCVKQCRVSSWPWNPSQTSVLKANPLIVVSGCN